MKNFRNILGAIFMVFAILTLYGSVTDLQANFLKKAYHSVKKKAKKIVHKGKKYVKKGKKILHKGKVIGKSIGRGYVLIGKELYKATKNTSKGIFKIGKTFYTLEAKGLIFVGKAIFYDGLLIGNVIGKGLVKVDGVVYEVAKGVKASAARADDLVLGRLVYRKKGSHHSRRVFLKPDLVITKIYLDRKCQVLVQVKNVGKGKIPVNVWTQKKPNSSSIYLKVNGKNWGGATIWSFDKAKRLLKPGGSALYKSNLKVKNTQNITAIADMTRQIAESNEGNNAKSKKLTCRKKPARTKRMPDLIVKNIKVAKGCGILVTIANIGKGGVPMSGYSMSNGVGIQMYNNNKPWGGIRLAAVDKNKKLSKRGKAISFLWFPGAKNLKLKSGKNRIKLVVDNNNALRESNEHNNAKTKTLVCMKPATNRGVVGKVHFIGKPDLIITSFGVKKWGVCKPGSAVMTFKVTIKNVGTSTSMNVGRKALVQVVDKDGSGWGNGAFVGALKPNQSKTVLIPVYYLKSNPGHMVHKAPHPFVAIADPLHLVKESNEMNNKTKAIKIGAPKGCAKAGNIVSSKISSKLPLLKLNKPDLIVKNIRKIRGCGIQVTIANIGKGGVPSIGYDRSNGVSIQMYNNNKPWGGIRLAGVDKNKKLSQGKGIVTFEWFSGAQNLKLKSGKNRIKVVIDGNHAVKELNENNNYRVSVLECKKIELKKIGKKRINIPRQKGSSSKLGIKTKIPKEMNNVMPNEPIEVPKQMPQGVLH